MKSILVHAGRDSGMTARLDTALTLARARDGHLTLLIDTPVTRYINADGLGGAMIAAGALNEAMADDDLLAEQLQAQLQAQDVPFGIVRLQTEPAEALTAAARLADLIVISRDGGFAGQLALAARTPVLALSRMTALPCPPATACIAWDGGSEAGFALRQAMPLLASARAVHVLAVELPEDDSPAGDALGYLALHGIKAEFDALPRRDTIQATLWSAAMERSAELLVMGAYSHSPLREALFGGVTRHFLEQTGGPALLLAH